MDTTSISELPGNNITMTQVDKDPGQQQMPQQMPQQMSQQMPQQMPQSVPQQMAQPIPQQETQIQQIENAGNINSVLERARQNGSLSLPSRDIPMNTTNLTHDNEALPDFIPNKKEDYIEEMISIEELQERRRKERNKEDSLEELYKELQVPIFIGILYFIFQLPITNKYFHKFFTFGFKDDGNMNLQGYLVKSFLFASIYYIIHVFMNKLSNI